MNMRHFLSTAAVAALLAGPAYAQTGNPSPTGAQPGMTQNVPGSGAGTMQNMQTQNPAMQQGANPGRVGTGAANGTMSQPGTMAPAINQAQNTAGKWRASKLMGVDIYGPNNEKVGDVTEVIVDRNGRIESVTVGVGGFLGIGTKDVAIPFDQIAWSDQPMTTGSVGTTNNAVNTTAAPGTAGTGIAGTGVAVNNTTGTTSGTAMNRGAGNTAAGAYNNDEMYPDHGRISMTRAQLEAAPAVSYSR
jgi:sporulation protein YlmC with PRC-barrel domain